MITSTYALLSGLQSDFSDFSVTAGISRGIRWPNARFVPPDIGTGGLWATYDVVLGETQQVSLGNPGSNRFRVSGVVQISIYSDPEKGDQASLLAADSIADHYRAAVVAGAQFRAPSIQVGAVSGGWWTTTIQCPFYADRLA